MKKILAGLLSVVMAFSCVCVPAFATDGASAPVTIAQHPTDTMNPTKTVYAIGTQSFYKVEGTTVVFADKDGEGFEAVPSKFILGSEYNTDAEEFGVYVTDDGEVHFVKLSACNLEADGSYTFYHGTKDSATVSEEVDTATNQDPTMGTDFYINIENGIDPDGFEKEDVESATTEDPRVDYEITVATKTSYQLKATVPAFVCMYGYRGTGNVVTPTSDAYGIKNYSTMNAASDATIVDIVKITHLARIYDEDHSNEELYSIAYDEANRTYTYWYSDPSTADGWVEPANYMVINDLHINASGECYVIFIDGEYTFKAAGALEGDAMRETVAAIDPAHPLANDFVFDEWNFGKEFAVGDTKKAAGTAKEEGLAIKVTDLEAKPATWRLVPTSTSATEMKRGELAMSIAPVKAQSDASAIDLSKCSAPMDITAKGWFLDAPVVTDGVVAEGNETTLGLVTRAQMAGSNVNDAGCTPVVRVNYTVTPMFDLDNGQINTVTPDGGNATNRQ